MGSIVNKLFFCRFIILENRVFYDEKRLLKLVFLKTLFNFGFITIKAILITARILITTATCLNNFSKTDICNYRIAEHG